MTRTTFLADAPPKAAHVGRGRDVYAKMQCGDDRWFAKPAAVRTPMGSGVVAFADAEGAKAADRAGRALSWDEVVHLAREER